MNSFSPQDTIQVCGIQNCPTGITGLDEVLNGGLPHGRPTLVCGSAGCGKTLMACEFLVRGVQKYGEPVVSPSAAPEPLRLQRYRCGGG